MNNDFTEFHAAAVKLVDDMLSEWIDGTIYRDVPSGLQARINALLTSPAPTPSATAVDSGARDEREAFDVALDALSDYQNNWDTGLAQPYAESERIAMECAVEAVREALNEARAALSAKSEAAAGEPIYQNRVQGFNAAWQDVSKECYEECSKLDTFETRIVYAAPTFASKDWCMKMARLEPDNVDLTAGVESCDKPPPGWFCTRGKGHEGPCAAHPAASGQKREDDK